MDIETPWNEILFFPGEDPEALKTRFVELWAHHGERFPVHELAQYVFKNLRDPSLRAGRAAQVWSIDIDVIERVRELRAKGAEQPDDGEISLRRYAIQIVKDPHAADKDKIAAIALLAKMGGHLKKDIDLTTPAGSGGGNSGATSEDFLAALAEKLPN